MIEATGDEFPPWNGEESNVFYKSTRYTDVNIEDIEPSQVKAYSTDKLKIGAAPCQSGRNRQQIEEEREAVISSLNELTADSSKDDLISLIRRCHSLNLRMDINRLARFAMCRNALVVLKYLVDEGKADFDYQDTEGRSAIFYALWDYTDTQIFEYIKTKISLEPNNLSHRATIFPQTALDYAVTFGRLDAIEFLLKLNVNAQSQITKEPWCVRSLFAFEDLIRIVPAPMISVFVSGIPMIGVTLLNRQLRRQVLTEDDEALDYAFDEAEKTNGTIWVHLPWANGAMFFFALRIYGQKVGYSITTTDWLPSLFRQDVKVPANHELSRTEPLYESNFDSPSESARGKLRALIIFPCLMIWKKANQKAARNFIDNIRDKITPDFAKDMIEPPLTLDESYFPSLPTEVLKGRNESQVVSRNHQSALLMVSQLWIWRCDRSIVTAFSADKLSGPFDEDTVTTSVSKIQTIADLLLQPTMTFPNIQIGLFIAKQISAFGNRQANGEFPSLLDIFDASTAQVLTDVEQYMNKNTLSPDDMEDERRFMFRIADIRKELVMIQKILGQQLEILQSFINDFEHNNPDAYNFLNRPLHSNNAAGKSRIRAGQINDDEEKTAERLWEKVKLSGNTIKKYQERVKKIDRDAEMVEKRIQDQLNLKQTYASIKDARASLTLAIAVIWFTVITIIFTPLAFVTALFALPIDFLLKNQFLFNEKKGRPQPSIVAEGPEPTRAYTTTYVGTWFAVAEVTSLVVTVLIVALFLRFPYLFEYPAEAQGDHSELAGERRGHDVDNMPDESTVDPRLVDLESGLGRRRTGFWNMDTSLSFSRRWGREKIE